MAIPDPTRNRLTRRLDQRRRERWPGLSNLNIRYRASFAYVAGVTVDDGESLPLFRLRYLGSADQWGFAIYLASKDGYEDSVLPHGSPIGTPEQALDCACGLCISTTPPPGTKHSPNPTEFTQEHLTRTTK